MQNRTEKKKKKIQKTKNKKQQARIQSTNSWRWVEKFWHTVKHYRAKATRDGATINRRSVADSWHVTAANGAAFGAAPVQFSRCSPCGIDIDKQQTKRCARNTVCCTLVFELCCMQRILLLLPALCNKNVLMGNKRLGFAASNSRHVANKTSFVRKRGRGR